ITLKSDFLVKGGAGTGKTLILLEAMKEANAGILPFANKKMLLLTYTNTLVKYDRYISDIMKIDDGESQINTADSYLNNIFENFFPAYTIDYSIAQNLCRELNDTDFFNDKQLKVEIEDFLLGYNISGKEYLDEMINRKGMKSKLTILQRQKVWEIKTSMEKKMLNEKTLSKSFSRFQLLGENLIREFDHIFIDESQDLYPIELQLLKRLSRSSLIMAGDTDQSIYGIGAPYERARISSGATTRILKTNFRNTIPIHSLAETFRTGKGAEFDKGITPEAFRDGPVPELYQSADTEILYDQLVEKVKIFVNTIEYDPENICILAPSAKFLNKIGEKLHSEGFSSVNIKDPEFHFTSQGSIRLSPLHSSKGLDIPVVLLFLPVLFYNRELDKEESENLVRNLLYVSMTRAMENLNVFIKEDSKDPVLRDLVKVMERIS
ncbi:MAG: DEAD/DEAH box helicase, partial [Spirochaetaceae bacterium]|nr:DEAD/DEAH box helicase [Spirochaetaceae bacterium]